jgi:hypothetical protein
MKNLPGYIGLFDAGCRFGIQYTRNFFGHSSQNGTGSDRSIHDERRDLSSNVRNMHETLTCARTSSVKDDAKVKISRCEMRALANI